MSEGTSLSKVPSRGDLATHVVDGLPVPVAVTRLADDAVVRVNAEFEEAYGHRGAEMVGRDFRQVHCAPGDREAALAALASGRMGSVEVRIRNRDGECCWAQADVARFDLEGSPVLLTTLLDLGGRKRAERQAAERAALVAEMARFPEMNPGPVVRLDGSGRVLLANPAATRLFGDVDVTGRSWFELCPEARGSFWEEVRSSGRAMAVEAALGGRRYVLTHARAPDGVSVFVYGSDVTDLRNAEVALEQGERMATLGTLSAGVAHELNNPAAAAQRAAEQLETTFAALQQVQIEVRALKADVTEELLEELTRRARHMASASDELDPLVRSDREEEIERWLDERAAEAPWDLAPGLVELGHDPTTLEALAKRVGPEAAVVLLKLQAQEYGAFRLLEEIRHASTRLVEIVGALKSYAYLGSAPVQDVDVNEGLRGSLVIMRNKLRPGIVVRQELDPALPRIQAYAGELNQVWTNLLDNAADAMGGEGTIAVRSAVVGERVVVEVEDDGPGIPPEIQARVFDAFFTTKPPGRGTGLGLNTVHKIVVEKHHGSIRVDSKPGSTRFIVELPLTPPPRPAAIGPEPNPREDD